MITIPYSKENLNIISQLIKNSLTPDLLPKKWVERNSTNPMFGHCHTAAACLQKIFTTKYIKLYRALDDEGIWHWWAVTVDGELIDLTSEQYTSQGRIPPYDLGQKASMLGFDYRKRVLTLLDKVLDNYSSNRTPP